jgi:Ca2+-binding EF-hand superfamily protein
MLRFALLFWLPALLLLPHVAKANDEYYHRQDGLWGSPTCSEATLYSYSVADLYLTISPGEEGWISLMKPISSRMAGDVMIEQFKQSESAFFVSYTSINADTMVSSINASPLTTEQDVERLADTPPAGFDTLQYQRCSDLPPGIGFSHAEGIRFMEIASLARQACSNQNSDCVSALFGFIDVTHDQKLSVAELARLMRIIVYATTAANPGGATEKNLRGTMLLATFIGPVVAKALISSMDYDADGQIAMSEIFYDRELRTMGPAMDGLSVNSAGSAAEMIVKGMNRLTGFFKF